jgi:hypothetical protein
MAPLYQGLKDSGVDGEPGPAAALTARVTRALGWNVCVPAYRDRVAID